MLEAVEAYYSARLLRFRLKLTAGIASCCAALLFAFSFGLQTIPFGVVWLLVAVLLYPITLSAIHPAHSVGLLPLAIASLVLGTYAVVILMVDVAHYTRRRDRYTDCNAPATGRIQCSAYIGLFAATVVGETLLAFIFFFHAYMAYELQATASPARFRQQKNQHGGDLHPELFGQRATDWATGPMK